MALQGRFRYVAQVDLFSAIFALVAGLLRPKNSFARSLGGLLRGYCSSIYFPQHFLKFGFYTRER